MVYKANTGVVLIIETRNSKALTVFLISGKAKFDKEKRELVVTLDVLLQVFVLQFFSQVLSSCLRFLVVCDLCG